MKLALLLTSSVLLLVADAATGQEAGPLASSETTNIIPKIHHPNVAGISLFAENPDIVTPVGVAVAPDGRVFVQENHTHKRNSDYKGPKTDRILVFEDTNGDGSADQRSVFYEGQTFSTDLLFGPDGHLYVSTRWFVGRFRDAANRKKADNEPEKIVVCNTEGDYPHNGVGGLAIDPANPDWLAFGFGENLGVDYSFVGTDGTRLSGGGEGGSTYRCRTDGTRLSRTSTGHWNAFGMAYDLEGNLFSTDNDPNATPPNRLLHVVPGADFGYEYRYGRSGRHPLVCWYGENPGTLGMIGALGEAACGLIPHGPGKLLSASWTDNRIDIHTLTPRGASFVASRDPLISGPDDFRPVHLSYSTDGKYLYFTDWVKLSYPVHGHGRVWRIEFKEPVQLKPMPRSGRHLSGSATTWSASEALKYLGSDDAYLRTKAVNTLTTHSDSPPDYKWKDEQNPIARAHYAVALKRIAPIKNASIIPSLLADADANVRFVGVKWIADEGLDQYRTDLEKLLRRSDLSSRDLRAVVAAIGRLSNASQKEFSPDDTLLELALDPERPASLRAMALQSVTVDHKRLTVRVLSSLVQSNDASIRREAVRSLALHHNPSRTLALGEIAANDSFDSNLRADAIAGISALTPAATELLTELAEDPNKVVAKEAFRSLVAAGIATRPLKSKPLQEDIHGWESLVNQASGEANLAVGRRLFFHPKLAGCYKCHAMNGRGYQIGPDLTTIHKQSDITSSWLLKHIVNPNAEMAPYYRPQQLLTYDGKVLTGLVIGKEGKKQAYLGSDGSLFYVDKNDIEERREITTSIMPSGLLDALDGSEIRDLLAFLLHGEPQ